MRTTFTSAIVTAVALALALSTSVALAQAPAPSANCPAPALTVENGKFSVTEDGKTTELKAKSMKGQKAQLAAARTTCRSGGGYTVCSNGRHGCVWSDRTGNLLGCGAGI